MNNNIHIISIEKCKNVESERLKHEEKKDEELDIELFDYKCESSLEDALKDGNRLFVTFIDGRYMEAVHELFNKRYQHFIFALGSAVFKSFKAFTTDHDDQLVDEAMEWLKFATNFADRHRKKHSILQSTFSFMSMTSMSNVYDSYTDTEGHAELFHAFCDIVTGLLSVTSDKSILGLVKGAIKFNSAHQSFKECINILTYKSNWSSEYSRMNFESGSRTGIGTFDLVVSLFPNKFGKVLNLIGFDSNRNHALNQIKEGNKLSNGLFYDLTSCILGLYEGFCEYFFEVGHVDVHFFQLNAPIWATRTPNSTFGIVGQAMYQQITGHVDGAIDLYQSCAVDQESFQFFTLINYVSSFALNWCYIMKQDWKGATDSMKVLKDGCKLSPALFTYLYATCLFMDIQYSDQKRDEMYQKNALKEISECLNDVPKLKRTFGGKYVFHEKLVLDNSLRYKEDPESMFFPIFDICYIWNIFKMMEGNEHLLQAYIKLIDDHVHSVSKGGNGKNIQKYSLLIFTRGTVLRNLNSMDESIDCFNEVLSLSKELSKSEGKHFLAQSCFEIGLINRERGNYVEAKYWLKRARDDYKDYMTQTMIRYRVERLLSESWNN